MPTLSRNDKFVLQLAAEFAQRMMMHDTLTVNRAIHTTYTETGICALRAAEIKGQRRHDVLLQCEERIEEIRAEARVKALKDSVVH